MNHEAIYALYPNVVTVDDSAGAFDANGNKVQIDLELVANWVNPKQYQRDRAAAYPSIADQLDKLYHEGYEGWKAAIQAVKDQYPKPTE